MTNEADQRPTPAPSITRHRIDYLDGLRAIAALYVVLHHIWLTTYPNYPHNDGPWVFGWLVYGHLAVSLFIVVSGFSLAIAPARRNWELKGGPITFIRRRAWRILPTYWAAIAFSCLVFGAITPAETGDHVSLKAVAVHAVLLQDVINSPKPNGAFWSIAIEFQIYFLFPLFLWFWRRTNATALLVTATGLVIVSYFLSTTVSQLSGLANLTPQFAALFVFGMGAAQLLAANRSQAVTVAVPVLSGLLFVSFVVMCTIKGSVWIDAEYFWIDLLVGASVALLLASLAGHRLGALRSVLAGWFLRTTGLFSYSIYCVHLPILWLVWHFGVTKLKLDRFDSFLVLIAVGVPAVWFGSYAFSTVFERPFLTRRSFRAWWELVSSGPRRKGQQSAAIESSAA